MGERAPDFELEGTDGPFRLSAQRGRRVVLLFYPADESSGCTKQFCSYRDRSEDFAGLDATIVGISSQDMESHNSFRAKHGLNVPLLVDADSAVAKQYGAHSPVMGARRAVVIVDEEGIVRHRHDHLLGIDFQDVNDLREALARVGTRRPRPRANGDGSAVDALKQRFAFSRTTDEDGAEVLHVDIQVEPGGGAARPHIHPAIEERFEVLSGRPSFLLGKKWTTASPGETVVIPPGRRHAYRNASDEPVRMVCHATPPSTLQEWLEDLAALGRSGKIGGRGAAVPTGGSALLQGALMTHHYRDMAVVLFPPLPRPLVYRVLLPALAWLGKRRGYRAGQFAEDLG